MHVTSSPRSRPRHGGTNRYTDHTLISIPSIDRQKETFIPTLVRLPSLRALPRPNVSHIEHRVSWLVSFLFFSYFSFFIFLDEVTVDVSLINCLLRFFASATEGISRNRTVLEDETRYIRFGARYRKSKIITRSETTRSTNNILPSSCFRGSVIFEFRFLFVYM